MRTILKSTLAVGLLVGAGAASAQVVEGTPGAATGEVVDNTAPVTDPVTGEVVDPVTGEPVEDTRHRVLDRADEVQDGTDDGTGDTTSEQTDTTATTAGPDAGTDVETGVSADTDTGGAATNPVE